MRRATTEREQQRLVDHCLAVLRHAEEVTANVAHTCRYFGINRHTFYVWLRCYQDEIFGCSTGVIDDTQLFNDSLQEWEDFYNFNRPTAASTDRPPTNG